MTKIEPTVPTFPPLSKDRRRAGYSPRGSLEWLGQRLMAAEAEGRTTRNNDQSKGNDPMTINALKTFAVGDDVLVAVHEPGGAAPTRTAGSVRGIVLHAGAEYDVLVHPGEDFGYLADVLERCDMTLDSVREGPVCVLRNCQPEWMTWV